MAAAHFKLLLLLRKTKRSVAHLPWWHIHTPGGTSTHPGSCSSPCLRPAWISAPLWPGLGLIIWVMAPAFSVAIPAPIMAKWNLTIPCCSTSHGPQCLQEGHSLVSQEVLAGYPGSLRGRETAMNREQPSLPSQLTSDFKDHISGPAYLPPSSTTSQHCLGFS